jgi:hypothetical protein
MLHRRLVSLSRHGGATGIECRIFDDRECQRVRRGDTGRDRDLKWQAGRQRHGSQSTGMAERVKPRSREAVRVFAQGFTRDDSPGETGC